MAEKENRRELTRNDKGILMMVREERIQNINLVSSGQSPLDSS